MQTQEETSSKKPWVKYLVVSVIGLVAAFLICVLKGIFRETDAATIVRIVSDAFTLIGILWICFGALTVLNKAGAFDGLGYSFQSMLRVWRNKTKEDGKPNSYYDYKKAADAKRKRAWHLIIVGAAFLVVAIVLVIIHSSMA